MPGIALSSVALFWILPPFVLMGALRWGPGALLLFCLAWLLVSPTRGGIVNRTIDDGIGDSQTLRLPIYLPATQGVWENELCVGCAIKPNLDDTFKRTYTAATYKPGLGNISITLDFNGTAIYVFFILANNAGDGITALTLANFTMDSDPPEFFQHAPDLTTTDYNFNSLVFSRTSMINAQHRLLISTSGVNTNVYVNFDYAIYTHDDDAPLLPLSATAGVSSSSSSSFSSKTSSGTPSPTRARQSDTPSPSSTSSSFPLAAVVGGAVGGVVILGILIFLLLFCQRRHRQRQWNRRTHAAGYVPPLVAEFAPSPDQQPNSVTSFVTQPIPQPIVGPSNYQQFSVASASQVAPPPPMSHSNTQSPYGGYPNAPNAYQGSSASDSVFSGSSPYYREGGNRAPLRSVTSGDHLSPTHTERAVSATSILNGYSTQPGTASNKDIVDIRRQRQDELDERLRTVQQEMMFLTSDITGEGGTRHQSLRRQRTVNRDQREVVEDVELSMEEMKGQLRVMKDQIAYLREQQRSAWAQGLSDDPPPGYTPTSAGPGSNAMNSHNWLPLVPDGS